MDYSKMSDQEINKNVAFALGCKEVVPGIFMSDDRRYEFEKPKNKGGYQFYFDPCNNPTDAWPIIADNEISIIFSWNEEGLHGATNQPWISSENANPLRAAMECFLMIKESTSVQDNPA